jgi:hypothetical protein
MSTRKIPNPSAKRASGRVAIPAYVLRNAKLIGRDLTAQSVAAITMAIPANHAALFVPEASAVESARAA